jgi:hypothetical protein
MCIERVLVPLLFAALLSSPASGQAVPGSPNPPANPFDGFDLPDAWKARFWGSPDAVALLEMDPKRLADLVPTQAGLRFCRCPNCDATETDEPLDWSIRKPKVVTCKRCGESFPNEKVPAPDKDKKIPEETIEVVTGRVHHYPYHALEAEKQRYPDERLYLSARRDYETREYFSKAALYAALRYREQPLGSPDPNLVRVACVLLLRFAQVYPNYATHLDQPGQPKYLEPAHLPPPYRRAYGTAKWDWSGSLDVPLNLVIAYALVRDDPALLKAGKLLNDPNPRLTIEQNLFRASAAFVSDQPQELNEQALQVDRGLLAVGRLLRDDALTLDAMNRLREFGERGFYHDGLWRQGDAPSHRRVMAMFDGWIERLLPPSPTSKSSREPMPTTMLALARSAGASMLWDAPKAEVQQVGWPSPEPSPLARQPVFLGGAGVARLAVGEGADALDLELRGMGQYDVPRSRRQAIRLAVGGRTVLGDLDDQPSRLDGWDRASVSHNTVLVDGLNQRETPRMMRETVDGGHFLFFAADPDFQVAVLDDPRSYPRTTTRYRQTVVACSGSKVRYAVSVFEVIGGLQHDQVFHASPGNPARWSVSVPLSPGPQSLLPPTIPYVANSLADDGRWFVQGYGEFDRMTHGSASAPSMASLREPGQPGVRLHFLGDAPITVVTGSTPRVSSPDAPGRAALLLRRATNQGEPLESTFVTVFDPLTPKPSLTKVGRMNDTPGFVVLYLETIDGPEHLVVNLRPGAIRTLELADGRVLTTDGFVVRARRDELMLAGGTVAVVAGVAVRQPEYSGKILASTRFSNSDGRGWFETDAAIPADPALVGRTLLIRHGDRTTHGWTLSRVEPVGANRVRLHVREEPGFLIEGQDRAAHYYQFPGTVSPGPHTFNISTIRR